jgi:hypothetical protein
MDMSKVADEIITDLGATGVPFPERARLHDALTQYEAELSANAEGRGFNEVRLAEAIVDRPGNYPDVIAERVEAICKRYVPDEYQ